MTRDRDQGVVGPHSELRDRNFPVYKLQLSLRTFGTVMGEVLSDPRSPHDTYKGALGDISVFPFASFGLIGIYSHLQNELTRPWEDKDPADNRFARSLKAFDIASVITTQTSLPHQERSIIKDVKSDTKREANLRHIELAAEEFPATPASLSVQASLSSQVIEYLDTLGSSMTVPAQTLEGSVTQATHLQTMLERFPLSGFERYFGNPEWNERMLQIVDGGLQTFSKNPHAVTLLLENKLFLLYSNIKGEVFLQAMNTELGQSQEQGVVTADALADVYQHDVGLREYFWSTFIDDQERHKRITDWFFMQPANMVKEFMAQAMTDVTSLTPNMKRHEQHGQIRKLLGIVADFQGRHPDHENLGIIQTSIAKAADSLRAHTVVSLALNVLRGNSPGIITTDTNEEVVIHTLPPHAEWDVFEREVTGQAEDVVVYVSPPPIDKGGKAVAVTSEVPAVVIEAAPDTAEIESVPEKLQLSRGEFALTQSRWRDAQLLLPHYYDRLSGHIDTQLASKGFDTSQVVDYIAGMEKPAKRVRKNFPTVLPFLYPDSERFKLLNDIGIQCVESSNDTVTVVLDAGQVGIDTVGPSRFLLRGTINRDGEFVVGRDAQRLPESNLEFLITYAARFAMHHAAETYTLEDHELHNLKYSLREYNKAQRNTDWPTISVPRFSGEQPRIPLQDTVLVPTGEKGGITALKLNWNKDE